MKVEKVSSPIDNKLLNEYWKNESSVGQFFQYGLTDEAFKQRFEYLNQQNYNRQQLVEVIRSYMSPFGISKKADAHLNSLNEGAVVVVGGQQAGLLTGPLFSVYKAITVILLAKQQEKSLGVPVVPLFWIAGEDHDLDEINHTYTMDVDTAKKRIFGSASRIKLMASNTTFDKEQLREYVKSIFKDYGETDHSVAMLHRVLAPIETSETYTAYFSALFNELFASEGLLLIDAAYTPFRKIQSDYFTTLIKHNEAIASNVVEQERMLMGKGFTAPLEATIENANIFYVQEGERFLLERKNGSFINALKGLRFTYEELVTIAQKEPERLSNNVVTRPLMQEMTLPVLAFVGGPGELAYWATLKTSFEAAGLQMPPFIPRLSITLVNRQAQYAMDQTGLTVVDAFAGRIEESKVQFISQQKNKKITESIEVIEQQLMDQYKTLQNLLIEEKIQLDATLERNAQYHQQQFDYLKRKIDERYEQRYEKVLRHMNVVQAQLMPLNKPQERLYNLYQFENEYGKTLVADLLNQLKPIEQSHLLIYL